MSTRTENMQVVCRRGFVYEVLLEHKPHLGFSTAIYNGQIIGQVEFGRILQPFGDDDKEWEMYEERYSEWTDEVKSRMVCVCEIFFDNK